VRHAFESSRDPFLSRSYGRGVRRLTGDQRGAATVEHAALAALLALLIVAAVSGLAARPPSHEAQVLGGMIARRIACGPRAPDACRHHPLVRAYGWPLARLARALVPPPQARPGPGGAALVPVDFRYCRSPSCAVPRAGAAGLHLTASGRRTTAFTSIEDLRRSRGYVEITYWLYRPSLGWERVVRRATEADVTAAGGTPVLLRDDPNLVPLETLRGRNHYDFPASEQPPWQWNLEGVYPG
jgi:hypothetical protein